MIKKITLMLLFIITFSSCQTSTTSSIDFNSYPCPNEVNEYKVNNSEKIIQQMYVSRELSQMASLLYALLVSRYEWMQKNMPDFIKAIDSICEFS